MASKRKSDRTGEKQREKRQVPQEQIDRIKPTQWKPGQSGNPGGRPRTLIMRDALLEAVMREAGTGADKKTIASVIANVLITKAAKGDLRAITELIDRLDGKAMQAHEVSGPAGGPVPYADLSREEKIKRLIELEAKVAGNGDDAE